MRLVLYDAMLMFYHGILAFDHVQSRLWIVRNVFTEGPGSLRAKYNAAVGEIKRTRALLEEPAPAELVRKVAKKKARPVKFTFEFQEDGIPGCSLKVKPILARAIFFRW